jgi:hypothetical protein
MTIMPSISLPVLGCLIVPAGMHCSDCSSGQLLLLAAVVLTSAADDVWRGS